jgi:hypothetical protein
LTPDIEFSDFIITEEDVLDQLKILNISKPPGPDGISPRVLKETCSYMYLSRKKIFSIYLQKIKCHT